MRKAVVIGVLAIAGLALAWEFVPIAVMVWDGRFPLSVEVVADGPPPSRVSCQVYSSREEAEQAQATAELHEATWTPVVTADPFVGQALMTVVRCSGRTSALGREVAWYQFKYLVVVAEWPDGRRVAKLVPTPDGQVSRSVEVPVPVRVAMP